MILRALEFRLILPRDRRLIHVLEFRYSSIFQLQPERRTRVVIPTGDVYDF